MASVSERKATPRAFRSSSRPIKSRSERPSRSSFQTTSVSYLASVLRHLANSAHHLSISHHFTKGRQREIILQTSLQVTQPPRKPRHGAAVEFSEAPMVGIGLGVGFFSSGVGQCNVSSRPTCTHQYIANDMIKIRRSRRFACSSCEVCRSKPRLLKSENVGSIAQRAP